MLLNSNWQAMNQVSQSGYLVVLSSKPLKCICLGGAHAVPDSFLASRLSGPVSCHISRVEAYILSRVNSPTDWV